MIEYKQETQITNKEVLLMKEENKIKTWVKAHKKELFIAGGVIVTAVGAVFLIDNMDAVKALIPEAQKKVLSKETTATIENEINNLTKTEPITKIIDVKEHLRNLSQGHQPSASKLAEAAKNGIKLAENQTIVSAHTRCYAA